MLFAATANADGDLLGQYCEISTGSCAWELGMATGCEEGSEYPVLVNSESGAIQLTVKCTAANTAKISEYYFTNFDSIDKLIKAGQKIGIAFPLQAGTFRAIYFSLIGSTEAVTNMRATAAKTLKTTPQVPPDHDM
ncbi:MAG: hypothetical protein ACRESS_01135 [Stenotrophobium sp.]